MPASTSKTSLRSLAATVGFATLLAIGNAHAFPTTAPPASNSIVGQGDYTTGYQLQEDDAFIGAQPASASTFFVPTDIEFDAANERMFVADIHNSRVLVFDLSQGLDSGMSAVAVLGQPDLNAGFSGAGFTWGDQNNTPNPAYGCAAGVNACGATRVWRIAYASSQQLLFASDSDNNRVLVWDLSQGISNGMPATAVLGQLDFTTATANTACNGLGSGSTNACGFDLPVAVAVNEQGDRLVVSDTGNRRLLVYDISLGVTTGMQASAVLGQQNFSDRVSHLGCDGITANTVDACGLEDVFQVAFQPGTEKLFASDLDANRILIFDMASGVTNGMAASGVIGQPNFTTGTPNTSCDGLTSGDTATNECGLGIWGASFAFDVANGVTYIADEANHRILVHDSLDPVSGRPADYIIGQSNFTDGYGDGFGAWGGSTTRSTLMQPGGILFDPVMDRLLVPDGGNHRVVSFGANVDGVPVNIEGGVTSMSTSKDLVSLSTTVEVESAIGDSYTIEFPQFTQPPIGNEEIAVLLSNPDETGWNLPTIDIDAELPVGQTKTIGIATGQFASVCILDHEDFEFTSGSYCNFDNHPHSYALPAAGECKTEVTHGDPGDNQDDPADPEGLHSVEICLAADLSSITVSGLKHTGMQLGRGVLPSNGGAIDDSSEGQSDLPGSRLAGCNVVSGKGQPLWLLFLLFALPRRRNRQASASSNDDA